jgi:hypothetical protein
VVKPILEGRAQARLALRLVAWIVAVVVWVVVCSWMRWVFGANEIRLAFPPKLPFLALVIAIGTFQYRLLFEGTEKIIASFTNPTWDEYERSLNQIRANPDVTPQDVAHHEDQLNRWHEWRATRRQQARQSIIPHNEAIIGNIFVIAGALLASLVCDIAFLISSSTDHYGLRLGSTALFTFTLWPFLWTVARYLIVFTRDAQGFYDSFKEDT